MEKIIEQSNIEDLDRKSPTYELGFREGAKCMKERLIAKVRIAEETAEQMAWNDYKRGKKEMLEKAWHWHKTHKDGVNSYDDFVKAMEIDMNERFIEFVEIYNKLDLSQFTDEELLQYSNMGNNMMLEANEELRKRIINKYKNK